MSERDDSLWLRLLEIAVKHGGLVSEDPPYCMVWSRILTEDERRAVESAVMEAMAHE
jgi:hypothetical protein